jgi:hypothetical protein
MRDTELPVGPRQADESWNDVRVNERFRVWAYLSMTLAGFLIAGVALGRMLQEPTDGLGLQLGFGVWLAALGFWLRE